jgi:hypothetical protein
MADAYEREQMPGVGEVLFRHKVSSPRWLIALLGAIPLALGTVTGLAIGVGGGRPVEGAMIFGGSAFLAGLLSVINVTFAATRIAVSEGELHLQMGFAGPKIPISQIASVELGPSGTNSIGMGFRSDLRGGGLYKLWGDNEKAVHVRTTDGRHLIFVMKEPEAMQAAIVEAMARRDRKRPQVRVEPSAEAEPEIEQSDSERAARKRQHGG